LSVVEHLDEFKRLIGFACASYIPILELKDEPNPNPGQRPGQIHYQDDTGKYIYDIAKKEFEGLSNTANENLLGKPGVQDAIQKGLKYLGVTTQ
jgi:hypothetical protein